MEPHPAETGERSSDKNTKTEIGCLMWNDSESLADNCVSTLDVIVYCEKLFKKMKFQFWALS